MIKVISEHSVDLSLLTRGSKVLDLGARNFGFSNVMLEYVDKVYAVDADPNVKNDNPKIEYLNAAVKEMKRKVRFVMWGNGTGNHVDFAVTPAEYTEAVMNSMTLCEVSEYFGVKEW